jgi:hypothetical protein
MKSNPFVSFLQALTVGIFLFQSCLGSAMAADEGAGDPQQSGIPIHFKADRPGFVTLVLEDRDGNRLKNLVFDHPVQVGDNIIYWDGSSLTGVAGAGTYQVRGIFHEGITPRLEYSFYSPGTPPWPTADGTGAWLADHTAPASALFLPEGSPWPANDTKPVVLLGADSAEAGNALMWVNLDGRKLGGNKIRGWNGGIALARDIGSQGNPNAVAYTVFTDNPSRDFGKGNPGALEIYTITKTGVEPLAKVKAGIQMHDAFRELAGLAAYNGLLLLSDPAANEIFAFDVRASATAPFATFNVDNLGDIAFEPDGKLLVATGGAIKRFTVANDWKTFTLTDGQDLVAASDLQAPKQIVEQDKEIYVTDWGTSHQVKVFDATSGKLVRTIGKPGGPQVGDYDEQRMAHPMGLCVDSKGVLWVAENDYLPKRISRWEAKTGRFINAWYGPTQYGGGGFVDPKDKSHAYYPSVGNPGSFGLLDFKVDLQTGDSKLTGVRYRYPDPLNDAISYAGYPTKPIFFPTDMTPPGSHGGTAPGQTFYFKGHQYFTNSYNTYWYSQGSSTTLWILENGVCRPIACCGWVDGGIHRWPALDDPAVKPKIPPGRPEGDFFVWTDRQHDHAVHPDDIQFIRPTQTGAPGVVIQPDLSVIAGGPFQLPVKDVDENGVPEYDLSQLQPISSTPAKGDVALAPDGWFIADCTGFKDGIQRWSFATRDATTPPAGPGELENPDRMLGYPVKSAQGEAGYMVARYSYMGEIYVYSTDGLLVTTLGADIRSQPFWPYPEQKIGMDITGLSFDAEQFWPFMFGLDDGNVYLSVGKWHTSIVRLDGLDKVKRVDLGKIDFTDAMIAAAAPARNQKAAADVMRDQVTVTQDQGKVDGDISKWPASGWARINPASSFQLGVSGDKLVVAYRTDQNQLLLNSATEFPFAFTQGGGLDLMLGTAGAAINRFPLPGDLRLFITKKNGQTLAVLYRQKSAGGHGNRQTFASPVGQITFDDVEDVSKDVQVAQSGGNYEFSVPLSVLGLDNPTGKTFRGDVGYVLSDGVHARARIYWHNKWDSMCADVPSEARLNPSQWGLFKF